METKKEVKVKQVDYICPECENGSMRPTGHVLSMDPPLYQHECTNCGNIIEIKGKTYPYVEYEEI